MTKDNVKVMPGVEQPNVMADALKTLKDTHIYNMEFIIINAALTMTKYNALIKEGFSEAQALELSKTIP